MTTLPHKTIRMIVSVGAGGATDTAARRLAERLAKSLGQRRRPNIFGDVSWCKARIADKRLEDGAHVVDLELQVDNQLGETTAKGTAVVELPARSARA